MRVGVCVLVARSRPQVSLWFLVGGQVGGSGGSRMGRWVGRRACDRMWVGAGHRAPGFVSITPGCEGRAAHKAFDGCHRVRPTPTRTCRARVGSWMISALRCARAPCTAEKIVALVLHSQSSHRILCSTLVPLVCHGCTTVVFWHSCPTEMPTDGRRLRCCSIHFPNTLRENNRAHRLPPWCHGAACGRAPSCASLADNPEGASTSFKVWNCYCMVIWWTFVIWLGRHFETKWTHSTGPTIGRLEQSGR